MIPLWVEQNAPGFGSWNYDPATFIIQYPSFLWWPDKMRLDGLLKNPTVFDCPALSLPATQAGGGSTSTNHPLGLGMNYPEYGWLATVPNFPFPVYNHVNENQVTRPAQSIVYADAGGISNPGEPDADFWREIPPPAAPTSACPATPSAPPRTRTAIPVPSPVMTGRSTRCFLTATPRSCAIAPSCTTCPAPTAPSSGPRTTTAPAREGDGGCLRAVPGPCPSPGTGRSASRRPRVSFNPLRRTFPGDQDNGSRARAVHGLESWNFEFSLNFWILKFELSPPPL